MSDYMKEAKRLSQAYADAVLLGEGNDEALAALLAHIQRGAVPEGYDIAPTFRGYAKLGSGHYVLHNCPRTDEDHPSLVIAIATESEKAGRQVGELRQSQPGLMIQPERIAVRIDFKSVAALDALEQQLRFLREDSFPDSLTAAAPDHFRAAAKMMAVHPSCMTCTAPAPAEVPMPEPDDECTHADDHLYPAWREDQVRTYGDAREAAGYARGLAEGVARTGLTPAEHDVLAERERQISAEGWTPDHDDEHDKRELSRASLCYVQQYVGRFWLVEDYEDGLSRYQSDEAPDEWPWDEDWWKPTAPRRDLVKAAALLLAEIERLDRAALRGEVKP